MRHKSFCISFYLLFLHQFTYGQTKLPYPIIFVHGLIGDANSWATFSNFLKTNYGLTSGGGMNFCLNSDYSLSNAYYPTDYLDFTASNNKLKKGDYYYINFDSDATGSPQAPLSYIESNQQAIFKQGRAVRDAIKHVLAITGKDKVILVGHSMGGLASREYLSNSSIWQSDGKHHVAKLFTNATPHGGSNTSFGTISVLKGVDALSDAVRDLRSYYSYLGITRYGDGTYLFGGVESNSNIYYSWLNNYNTVDVNCNGVIGENITGLNYKATPNDLYYSCGMGHGTLLIDGSTDVYGNSDGNGDGIVGFSRANMNDYMYYTPPLLFNADTFCVYKVAVPEFHTSMTKYEELNLRGLDEPSSKDLAYQIDTNKTYFGWATAQSNNYRILHYDIDSYKLQIPAGNKLRMTITTSSISITYDLSKNAISISTSVINKSSLDTIIDLDNNYGDINFRTALLAYTGYADMYSFKLSLVPFITIVQQPLSQTICGGNFATFSVSVAGVGPISYNWNNGATSKSITTSTLGTYFVTVAGLNGTVVSTVASLNSLNCITVSAPVILKQPSSQTVCGGSFATFTVSVSGQGSMSYKWNNGSTNSSLVTSTPGIYFVTVTGINGRVVSSTATLTSKNCTVTQINPTDISQLEVNVYPNPTENELTISISNLGNENTIELFNELGLSVFSFKSAEPSQKLDLRNLSKGFYILSIQIDNQFRKIKILKE